MSSPSPPKERLPLLRWGFFALLGLLGWWLLSGRSALLEVVPPQVKAGESALKAGDAVKAAQQFDAAIKADPANPAVYITICRVCADQKNAELTFRYGEQATAAFKDLPQQSRAALYMALASCYADVETVPHQEKAMEAAQRAFELNPDDPGIMNGYGYILADNDQKLDEAVPLLQRALELYRKQTNEPETRLMVALTEDSVGWALYKQGNYPAAVNAISQALTDLPDTTSEGVKIDGEMLKVLYFHLGAALHKAGRLSEARNALQSALRYDPSYAPAKSELDSLPPPAPPARKPETGANKTSGAKPGEDKTSISTNSPPQ